MVMKWSCRWLGIGVSDKLAVLEESDTVGMDA